MNETAPLQKQDLKIIDYQLATQAKTLERIAKSLESIVKHGIKTTTKGG